MIGGKKVNEYVRSNKETWIDKQSELSDVV